MSTVARIPATLRLAAASWRGQLATLALATALLGPSLHGITSSTHLPARLLLVALEIILLLGCSIHAALAHPADLTRARIIDDATTVATRAPRLVAHALLAALPIVAATFLALQLTSLTAILGLVLLPLALLVATLTAGPVLLALVAVMHGEQGWLPRTAYTAVRPVMWRIALDSFVGIVLASLAALPLVLIGVVILAAGKVFAIFGAGIAVGAVIPWLACWSIAMWRSLNTPISAPAIAASALASTHGPSWDVAVESGSVWGTWIQVEQPCHVGLRVVYDGVVAPDLLLCTEAGAWSRPGIVASSGTVIVVPLAAGNTYVQLGVLGPVAQALSLALIEPHRAAA